MTKYRSGNNKYDAIGNPTQYYNGRTYKMTWKGRELQSLTLNSVKTEFTYNADGLRINKTTGGVSHDYVWSGDMLLAEVTTDYTLRFLYNGSGEVIGFEHITASTTDTDITYYYEKNIFGDVIAIYDEAGNPVAAYAYNAYGQCHVLTNHTDDKIGSLNPIRYRSYYIDTDIYLYYLQTRYYDTVTCRFINADGQLNGGILGNNLFAYCENNPVARIDSNGEAWETVLDVVSLGFSVVEVTANPTDVLAWVGLVGDAVDLIPFVTGVGETVRVIRIGGKFFDFADDAHDTAKFIDNTIDGFGDLSKAKTYGIKPYNTLKKSTKGTGLQAHHIIEQRLVKHLNIDTKTMLSVAVTPAEHQVFTNAWRGIYEYGTDYSGLTREILFEKAQDVYKGYPKLIEASRIILFG